MQDRLTLMKQLQDHMSQLFQVCGVEFEKIGMEPPSALSQRMEMLVRDEALYRYLKHLDAQIMRAIPEVKACVLDELLEKQRNLRIAQLEEELRALRRWMEQLDQKAAQEDVPQDPDQDVDWIAAGWDGAEADTQLAELNEQRKQLRGQLERAQTQCEELREQMCAEQMELIRSIIAMRDNLLMRANWIGDYAPQEKTAAKLVADQLRETARLLERAGVEILDERGRFDCQRHTVVETRPAPSPELVDQIAETFRPGYRFQGQSLRAQEVILFT